ncbi:MAG: FAD-dependent monooxygenase [Anaerolineae bacterium]
MTQYDLIIVGAGPAGSAAAIQLARRAPVLAARTLILEKGIFPRHKLCGGGLTHHADDLLHYLGVWPDVPAFPIHNARLVFEDLTFTIRWPNAFRIVRREEFDMALAREAQARGVELHEGVTVRDLAREADGVTLLTDRGEYRARMVIGADGSNSVVRTRLGLGHSDRTARLIEILTSVEPARSAEFGEHTAVFDFTPTLNGVQGYYWDFPSVKQGEPIMNRGLYDSRVHPKYNRAGLKPAFAQELAERGVNLAEYKLMGHPERWFDIQSPQSAPNVILAGDAAGADPLLGEGIAHALNFGIFAADAAVDAFARNDFAFADYNRRIAWSALGRRLLFKRFLAEQYYRYVGHRGRYRFLWRIMRLVLGA